MEKVLWVKFGWSEYYRGGSVDGNFGWLNDQRGKKAEGRGHEAFNFLRADDGIYYCYVPPQAGHHAPSNDSDAGWTVVCLAKNPRRKGIYVVGWFEDAQLKGHWVPEHPAANAIWDDELSYCITSASAFFVKPEDRNNPFSDPSVRQGKYSFLAGPGIDTNENKKRVLKLLESQLEALRYVAIHNPDEFLAPDPLSDPADPLAGFGTPEHRKKVEEAAERAVVQYFRKLKFRSKRVAHLNCGYDYVFRRGSDVQYVEVKGTSTTDGQFYLTRNENTVRSDPRWRFARVTDALKHPNVTVYDGREFEQTFELEPYVFVGTPIKNRTKV